MSICGIADFELPLMSMFHNGKFCVVANGLISNIGLGNQCIFGGLITIYGMCLINESSKYSGQCGGAFRVG